MKPKLIYCPNCKSKIRPPEKLGGGVFEIKCPGCGKKFRWESLSRWIVALSKYGKNLKSYLEHEKHIEYYPNGKKWWEGTFKSGEIDGKYSGWFENGKKWMEGTFKDGKEDGIWTEWYENGQMKREANWKSGKTDGLWTIWHSNGQKKGEATNIDGKPDGIATSWYENGQRESEKTYKDGELVSGKCWDEEGNLIECS